MIINQTIKTFFSRETMMLLATFLIAMTSQTAWAVSVKYIDAEGVERTADATVITSSSSNLPGGWYVVKNNVTLTGRLNFTGDAHLILTDGATLTIPCKDVGNAVYFGLTCDKGDGTYNDLTIYGQSGGTGKISSSCGTTSSSWSYCYFAENITINGGVVEAAGTDKGIFARNNVTINGGQVSAVTTKIYASNGTLTLGWRKATDFIQAREYVGSIHFASRFIYQDKNNIISATDEKNENGSYLINNHKLEPDDVWGVVTSGADGSEEKPYIITTPTGLDLLAQNVNAGNNYKNKYFKLDANIIYNKNTENNFTPIGNNTYSFYGTFDGNGKTISELNINLPETDYVGLFGNVTGATIKSLTLANSTITGKNYVGGILGNGNYSNTIVQNCAVNNVTVSGTSCVGGIVGKRAIVRGCTSAATVKGDGDYVGGIVGLGEFTTIEYCLYTGNSVTTKYYKVGAIIGDEGSAQMTANYYTQATIGGCYRADRNGARKAYTVELPANVVPSGAATTYDVSGITAYAGNNIIRYNNGTNSTYYSGDGESVTLSYTGNDLADGYAARYTVNRCAISGKTFTMPASKATVTTTSSAFIWGEAGKNDGSSGTKAYVITTTEGLDLLAQKVNGGTDYSGKFFKLGGNITYDKNKENNFTPIGNYIGEERHPFGGTFDGNGKTISGLNINLPETNGVGLFGRASSATIMGVKLDNSIIKGKQCVGGILGIGSNSSTVTIQNCAVTNDVTVSGTSFVGGITSAYATVSGCTSAAAVSGIAYVGGILGLGTNIVERCLYTGSSVTATSTVNPLKGAIIGSKGENCSLKDNYYTQVTIGGWNGQDVDGARKAVVISAADGVTIAPTGEAKTYDVSGITAYADNKVLGCAGKLNVDANTETVKLNISYTVPEGYALTSYTDGNSHALTANNDGTYTLTMTDAAPTITPTTVDVWGVAAGANGESKETTYVITTTDGLDLLAQKVNAGNTYKGKYFKLDANITYDKNKENNFTPIGTNGKPFGGTFDGDGKTISGLNINLSTDYAGLFGNAATTATIKDMKLDNSTIKGKNYVGGIVGIGGNKSITVENCAVTSNVTVNGSSQVGGIVGMYATVSGCTSAAAVSGFSNVGGIIGGGASSTVDHCLYTGSSVTATNTDYPYYGAITGYNDNNTTLTANYYTADLACKGVNGEDKAGARKAVKISAAEGVTITPTGKATNYNVSGITAYDGNKVLGCAGKFYSNEDEAVKFSIAYTGTPETGYEFSVFNFGEGVTVTASEDVYTLTVPASDVTVDVDYEAITYAITYAGVDGATFSTGKTEKYTIETATFTLNNPSKEGYVFAGWTYTGQTTPTATVTIDKGSTGDKAYTANWKKLLTNDNITVAKIDDQTYTGSEIKPAITVKDGTTDITNQCDITFANNKAVGTATVTIKAKAASTAYAGETTKTFEIILKGDMNGDKVVNVADIVKAINDGRSQKDIKEIEKIIMKK